MEQRWVHQMTRMHTIIKASMKIVIYSSPLHNTLWSYTALLFWLGNVSLFAFHVKTLRWQFSGQVSYSFESGAAFNFVASAVMFASVLIAEGNAVWHGEGEPCLLIFPSSHDHSGCPSAPETMCQRTLETHTHTHTLLHAVQIGTVWSLKKNVSSLVELEGQCLPAAAQSWPPVAVIPEVIDTVLLSTSLFNQ